MNRFDGTSAKWKRHSETLALPQGAGQFVLADFDADGAASTTFCDKAARSLNSRSGDVELLACGRVSSSVCCVLYHHAFFVWIRVRG